MGIWGPKIYQNDIAEDVRDYYIDKLHRGKIGPEITRELLAEYQSEIKDEDDGQVFWFALADTQWNLGRLEDYIKERALFYINEGKDLQRWKDENPKDAIVRAKALIELEKKINSPQPPEKKISQYRLYQCKWKIGDLFALQLTSDLARKKGLLGRYLLIHKIGEDTWWPGHIIPAVRLKFTIDSTLPKTIEEVDGAEYIQVFSSLQIVSNIPEYIIKIITTSQRVIPQELHFLGNFQNIKYPEIEYKNPYGKSGYNINWKELEQFAITQYCYYNLNER